MERAAIWIGTSGWEYKGWKEAFYPAAEPVKGHLEYYAAHFGTVEVNNSFYRLPSKDAIRGWVSTVPSGFRFAVKASRFITHMKKLKDPERSFDLFFDRVSNFGSRLGPILFQLPPRWRLNLERLEAFLKILPPRQKYAFEFREPSWLTKSVYDLLASKKAAVCIYDFRGEQAPIVDTAPFYYLRFHGPLQQAYQGSYSDEWLRSWAKKIKNWQRQGKSVYCYFDNDQKAFAVANALSLRRCTGS